MKADLVSKDQMKIVISIEGRIDYSNSEELSEQLERFLEDGQKQKVEIDLDKLEYLSSSGIRILVKLEKRLKDRLVIRNVSPAVYDIFDTTGLIHVMDIRRAVKSFDISGLEKLGQGVSGSVYKVDEELIVKIYNPDVTYEMAEKEQTASRESFVRGVPTAIAFEIIKSNGSYGVKYELMNGTTLGRAFMKNMDGPEELVEKYVALTKQVSEAQIEQGVFPKTKDVVMGYLANLQTTLNQEDYELIYDLLNMIPEGERFVHGDLHPGNVMLQNGELLLIDMADVSVGWEFYDLTQIYNDIDYSLHLQGFTKTVELSVGMKKEVLEKVWKMFLSKYYETEDEKVLSDKAD